MKTKVIAELSWGHDGSLNQAIDLLKAAKQAGANIYSIHLTHMSNYMVPYFGNGKGRSCGIAKETKTYDYLNTINLQEEEWLKLQNIADFENIELCIVPNDSYSLEFVIEKMNPTYYGIATSSIHEYDLIKKIASQRKATFFRVGGASLDEIQAVISIFNAYNNPNLILMHGFQKNSILLEDSNLSILKELQERYKLPIGIADHVAGNKKFAKIIPSIAISMGATYVEKHITLNKNLKSEDFQSALEMEEFKEMVSIIRDTELAIGIGTIETNNAASKIYNTMIRKKIIASNDIPANTIITNDMLSFKRCDIGIEAAYIQSVLYKRTKNNIQKNDAILNDLLE